MEVKQEITEETLAKIKSLPRLDYEAYKQLIEQKQVKRLIKLKSKRTIFFIENENAFYYLNPVYNELHKCGEFIE